MLFGSLLQFQSAQPVEHSTWQRPPCWGLSVRQEMYSFTGTWHRGSDWLDRSLHPMLSFCQWVHHIWTHFRLAKVIRIQPFTVRCRWFIWSIPPLPHLEFHRALFLGRCCLWCMCHIWTALSTDTLFNIIDMLTIYFFICDCFPIHVICLASATVHQMCPDGFWRMLCFSTLPRLKQPSVEPNSSYARPTILPVLTLLELICHLLIQLKFSVWQWTLLWLLTHMSPILFTLVIFKYMCSGTLDNFYL